MNIAIIVISIILFFILIICFKNKCCDNLTGGFDFKNLTETDIALMNWLGYRTDITTNSHAILNIYSYNRDMYNELDKLSDEVIRRMKNSNDLRTTCSDLMSNPNFAYVKMFALMKIKGINVPKTIKLITKYLEKGEFKTKSKTFYRGIMLRKHAPKITVVNNHTQEEISETRIFKQGDVFEFKNIHDVSLDYNESVKFATGAYKSPEFLKDVYLMVLFRIHDITPSSIVLTQDIVPGKDKSEYETIVRDFKDNVEVNSEVYSDYLQLPTKYIVEKVEQDKKYLIVDIRQHF